MAIIELNAELRTLVGSNQVKQIRKAGNVPAIMYGEGNEPVNLTVEEKTLAKIYRTDSSYNTILNLQIGNSDTHKDVYAISCAVDRNPMTGHLMHVDFKRLDLKKKMKTIVPLHFEGTPAGVKKGGVFIHHVTEVEIECLPQEIPGHISVNVASLDLDQALHIRDIHVGENVHILNPQDQSVGVVEVPKVEAEPEATTAEATPAAGATATPAAAAPGAAGKAAPAAKAEAPKQEKKK